MDNVFGASTVFSFFYQNKALFVDYGNCMIFLAAGDKTEECPSTY